MVSALFRHRLVHAAIAAVFLMCPAPAAAQEVGVKAGANSASLTPEDDVHPATSRRFGPVAGVWVRMAPASRVSFQVEGLFSEKGMKSEVPELGASIDVGVRYLEIPLLARAAFGASGSAARVFVVGGAAPAFKLSARGAITTGGQKQARDIDDEIYSADLGLVGGLGLQVGRALIEARYTHGLRHINTDDNGDEDRIKNRVFSLIVGIRLH